MLTLPGSTEQAVEWPAYRPYRASVGRIRRLSPRFVRVTFLGDDFATFGTAGLDQRVKVLFPLPGVGISDIGASDPATLVAGDWYTRWRALPDRLRNPFRTYTVRAVRPELRELDVDFVVHGDEGPAARWLPGAAVGSEVVIVGPDARSADSRIGLDWHPGTATRLFLAGDETAAPAICSILENLPAGARASAFIEVPSDADALPIESAAHIEVTWLARDAAPNGDRLQRAVRSWVATHRDAIAPVVLPEPQALAELDVDLELLWDSPAAAVGDFYAWLAGEASVIKQLRRFLVTETGIDRSRVAFMGYWRAGKAEAQ